MISIDNENKIEGKGPIETTNSQVNFKGLEHKGEKHVSMFKRKERKKEKKENCELKTVNIETKFVNEINAIYEQFDNFEEALNEHLRMTL